MRLLISNPFCISSSWSRKVFFSITVIIFNLFKYLTYVFRYFVKFKFHGRERLNMKIKNIYLYFF